jgi:hypothetical protein
VAGSNRYEVVVGPLGGSALGEAEAEADGLLLSLGAGVRTSEEVAAGLETAGLAESSLTRISLPSQPEKKST